MNIHTLTHINIIHMRVLMYSDDRLYLRMCVFSHVVCVYMCAYGCALVCVRAGAGPWRKCTKPRSSAWSTWQCKSKLP